jgi:hypothetical protein
VISSDFISASDLLNILISTLSKQTYVGCYTLSQRVKEIAPEYREMNYTEVATKIIKNIQS